MKSGANGRSSGGSFGGDAGSHPGHLIGDAGFGAGEGDASLTFMPHEVKAISMKAIVPIFKYLQSLKRGGMVIAGAGVFVGAEKISRENELSLVGEEIG